MCKVQDPLSESFPWTSKFYYTPLYIIKNKFHTKNREAPKSAGPVAIATFDTIVYPTLFICPHMHKAP